MFQSVWARPAKRRHLPSNSSAAGVCELFVCSYLCVFVGEARDIDGVVPIRVYERVGCVWVCVCGCCV